jgi:phosphatidylglycerophosphatase A
MPRFARLLLTGFGMGHLKPAPGTWGSALPAALAWLFAWMLSTDGWSERDDLMLNAAIALFGLLFAIACLRFGRHAEAAFGSKDPQVVVADEVAGQCLAMLLIPWSALDTMEAKLLALFIAFAAFRAFDIIKPPPIMRLQRLPGGVGILADDLVAGAFAFAVTQAVVRIGLPVVWGGE